jgi:hypothetical protein
MTARILPLATGADDGGGAPSTTPFPATALGQVLVMAWAAQEVTGAGVLRATLLTQLVDDGDQCYREPTLTWIALAGFALGRTWGLRVPIPRAPRAEAGVQADLPAPLQRQDGRASRRLRRDVLRELSCSYARLDDWRQCVHTALGDDVGTVLLNLLLGRLWWDDFDDEAVAAAGIVEVAFALGSAEGHRSHLRASRPALSVIAGDL